MDEGFAIHDIEELIKRVVAEKVEIELTITPDEKTIRILPWKPFEYSCPYKGAQP